MAGFAEFFYNIIPGALFQIALILTYFYSKQEGMDFSKIGNNTAAIIIALFVITSLFIGFSFQMINSWRNWLKINKTLIEKYKNNENDYKHVLQTVKKFGASIEQDTKDQEFNWLLQLHYYMDDYLRFKGASSLHKFFHFRISLWANITSASILYACIVFILLILNVILGKQNIYCFLFLTSTIIAVASYYAAKKSQEIYCDFVLKTFLMATGEKKK